MQYALTLSFAKTESVTGRWNCFWRKIPKLSECEQHRSWFWPYMSLQELKYFFFLNMEIAQGDRVEENATNGTVQFVQQLLPQNCYDTAITVTVEKLLHWKSVRHRRWCQWTKLFQYSPHITNASPEYTRLQFSLSCRLQTVTRPLFGSDLQVQWKSLCKLHCN